MRARTKLHGTTVVDFDFVSLKDSITKIVLHDLDLFFKGKQFEMLKSLKWRDLAQKNASHDF